MHVRPYRNYNFWLNILPICHYGVFAITASVIKVFISMFALQLLVNTRSTMRNPGRFTVVHVNKRECYFSRNCVPEPRSASKDVSSVVVGHCLYNTSPPHRVGTIPTQVRGESRYEPRLRVGSVQRSELRSHPRAA